MARAKKAVRKTATVQAAKAPNATRIIRFEVPYDLIAESEAILEKRGSSIVEYLKVKLATFQIPARPVGLDDLMPFGKYKGVNVGSVIRIDPDYVCWADNNVERFTLNEHAAQYLIDLRAGDMEGCHDN